MRGKATSFAPIIIGRKKLPNTAGIPGTMNKKTSLLVKMTHLVISLVVVKKLFCDCIDLSEKSQKYRDSGRVFHEETHYVIQVVLVNFFSVDFGEQDLFGVEK